MKSVKKLLVPVDGSIDGCKAVDEAIDLAKKCNAEMFFIYVSSKINKDIPSDLVFDRIWTKLPENIHAEKIVETGSISKAILRTAEEKNVDMIVMGSRGLSLFKGALMGSVCQKVVERSQIPVMVVKDK